MGYYENIDWIWKIWDLINRKLKEITFITFDGTISNKSSKKLLKSLADNSNQKLNSQVADTYTYSDSHTLESTSPKKKPLISNLKLQLSSTLFSF